MMWNYRWELINGLLFLNSTGAIFRKKVGPNIWREVVSQHQSFKTQRWKQSPYGKVGLHPDMKGLLFFTHWEDDWPHFVTDYMIR